MNLFRPEAKAGYDRLHGDVSLAPPLSWQVLGYFLSTAIAITLLFLVLASYAQRTKVNGRIEADRGVVRVTLPRAGTLSRIHVREGQAVRRGQLLAEIEVATNVGSKTLEEQRAAALDAQAAAVVGRLPALLDANNARLASLQAQAATQRSALRSIDGRLVEQRGLVTAAQQDLTRAQAIARNGFVSGNDIRKREETRSLRQQELLRLEQEREDTTMQVRVSQADENRARADLALARADLARDRGVIAEQAAADPAQRWFRLTAIVDGTVTGIEGFAGAHVALGKTLMSIIPTGTRLVARLGIPTSAAGFVRPGQRISISVDAFPRQLYGTLPARIAYVTRASVPDDSAPPSPSASAPETFIAQAVLERPFVMAYGNREPLRPGMGLTATIVTRRQSLVRWLLDPIYAVASR